MTLTPAPQPPRGLDEGDQREGNVMPELEQMAVSVLPGSPACRGKVWPEVTEWTGPRGKLQDGQAEKRLQAPPLTLECAFRLLFPNYQLFQGGSLES